MATATTTAPQPYYATSTSAINPFTSDGAAAISQIAGQQPASSTPASVLSAPSLPSLPQPAQTPVPAAPTIPSLDSIFNTPDTPLDTEFKTASANAGSLGAEVAQQPVFEDQQETAAGIPGLKATVTDLTSRLNSLKSDADAIPLQVQQDYTGRGATDAGVEPIQTAQLRNNTIQQLGVSAMLNAANGNLTTAQAQVDSAVKAKFDPIQAQLDAQKAQLDAITPLLTNEEKQTAAKQTAQLQDRQDALTQQKTDMATGVAMATAASKLNPNDPVAQQAAQQALKLDPSDPQYLAKITAFVGKYQQDPTATAQAVATLASTRADIAYKNAQTAALNATTTASSGNSLAQNNLKTTSDGTQYIDGSSLTGKDEQSVQAAAAAAGIPYVNAADSAVLDNIAAAQTNLGGIQAALANVSPSNALSRLFEIPNYAAESVTQSGPEATDLASYSTWKAAMISAVKGIAGPGTGGARGAALVQRMMDTIPSETDTASVAANKIATLNSLLKTAQQSILGTLPSANTTVMTGPDGKQYNVPNAQVAAFTAAGGHK